MKQLFITSKKNIILCIGAVVLVMFLSQLESIISLTRGESAVYNGMYGGFIMEAIGSDAMFFSLPILAALPYTASFVDEVKSGYIKQHLHRTTIAGYIGAKIGACALSGAMVMFLGIMLAYGLSAAVFIPLQEPLAEGMTAQGYIADITKSALLFGLSGGLWALIGMTFATLTGNKYMAYASPFIFYYVLIILNERYFPDAYMLYPKEWIAPSEFWMLGEWGAVIWVLELCVIVAMCFVFAAKRRISRL